MMLENVEEGKRSSSMDSAGAQENKAVRGPQRSATGGQTKRIGTDGVPGFATGINVVAARYALMRVSCGLRECQWGAVKVARLACCCLLWETLRY